MFTLPDLPYPYEALEPYIDTQTMRIHHDKHHAAYVKNTNDTLAGYERFRSTSIEEILRKINDVPAEIRGKVRNHGGGHANHLLFWQIMGPKAGGVPKNDLAKAIDVSFGNYSNFQDTFTKTAMGRFGSGWAWLVVEAGKLTIVDTQNQDTPLSEGKIPVLALDVWEHAYYLKYQNMRAEYINAWWNVVNWRQVERLYDKALITHI